MSEAKPGKRGARVRLLLKVGDCFAFDSEGYKEGDIQYGEVLEVHHRFDDRVDCVGSARSGCRIRAHCSTDAAEGHADGTDDWYGWDFFELCVRLSREHFERARAAGWPTDRTFLEDLGIVFRRN